MTAKKMITPKSFTTTTPMDVCVKGPLARSSLMTAMADAGDRAAAIVPAIIEIAIFAANFSPSKKGIISVNRYIVKPTKRNGIYICVMVIEMMLFILLLRSFRKSSDPTAIAIKASAISFRKLSLGRASTSINPRISGPEINPINRNPVINGSFSFWNILAIVPADTATIAKTLK